MEPEVNPALEPTGKIASLPWLTARATRDVFAALTAEGTEIRFVGGCVRDSIAKRPVEDVDIATPDPPEKVMELLERAGIRAVPTGIDHGTVTAVVDDRHFEVTTLRVDIETYGRRAKVAFTDDWEEDAARRDFTINTLSCSLEGDVYDPFGRGLGDLGHGRIRFVGNAQDRIEEDVLRLLRFFRFYGDYGRPPADTDALAACRALAPRLSELSGQRVRDEFLRILMTPDPADVVNLMRGQHVLEHVLPEAEDTGQLRALAWLETRAIKFYSVAPDALRRLAALIKEDEAGTGVVADRLKLSNDEGHRLVRLAVPPMDVIATMSEHQLRRALHRLGADTVRDLALLSWAGILTFEARQTKKRTAAWQNIIATADAWTPLELPVKGRDVLDLGVAAGPRVGEMLAAVEDWWEDGDYGADRAACLDKLKELAAGAA